MAMSAAEYRTMVAIAAYIKPLVRYRRLAFLVQIVEAVEACKECSADGGAWSSHQEDRSQQGPY
jgi:hypothetical protein